MPISDARSLKVRNHALTLLFETPFTVNDWHNFAVQVDWTNRTLGILLMELPWQLSLASRIIRAPRPMWLPKGIITLVC
jgi:hypothetical protein